MPTALLVLTALALAQASPVQDRIVAIVLDEADPVLAGHGASERVEHETRFAGALFAWVSAEGSLDTFLRAENSAGELLGADDDSGGRPTPFLTLPVAVGTKLSFFVAASKSGDTGRAELHLLAGPEDEALQQAAAAAQSARAKAQSLARNKDFAGAKQELSGAIHTLLATRGSERSPSALSALSALGAQSYQIGDLGPSEDARSAVVASLEVLYPPDQPVLQQARAQLVWTLRSRGKLERARALDEQVLAARTRTLPADHPDLQWTRLSLAWTLRDSAELQRSKELAEQALEVRTRTLPDDNLDLQWARTNLARTLTELGQLDAARILQEKVLAVREKSQPADSPDLGWARADLAWCLFRQGEVVRAKELEQQVLEMRTRTLPEDHFDLQAARANLAAILLQLGEPRRAEELQERVLEIYTRTLDPGAKDLLSACNNLALTVRCLGDSQRARRLLEQVLAGQGGSLASDNPERLRTLSNLAETLRTLGDPVGAGALLRRVVASQERVLPEGHRDLCTSIHSLASVELALGHEQQAIELLRRLLATELRRLPPEHIDVLGTKSTLGWALMRNREDEEARQLFQEVLTQRESRDPASPGLLAARLNLGVVQSRLGQHGAARALYRQVLAGEGQLLPRGCELFQVTRGNLMLCEQRLGNGAEAAQIGLELGREACASLEQASIGLAPREAEGVAQSLGMRMRIGCVLRLAIGRAGSAPASAEFAQGALTLVETARNVGLASRRALRAAQAASGTRVAQLRQQIQDAAADVSVAAISGSGSGLELQERLRSKESAERALREASASLGARGGPRPDLRAVAGALGEHDLAVSFWLDDQHSPEGPARDPAEPRDRVLAGLLASDGSVRWVDLGDCQRIARSVERWRAAVLAPVPRGKAAESAAARDEEERAAGVELAQLVVVPLRAVRPDARRWCVALDEALHLVPLDALPDGAGVLGDTLEVDVVAGLSMIADESTAGSAAPRLVELGGIEFDSAPAEAEALAANRGAGRGSSWERGFAPLPETSAEVRTIEALFQKSFPDAPAAQRLEERAASKPALFELAPRASFLHLATHGFFAPEAAVAAEEQRAQSKWVDADTLSFADEVRGLSPWSLCGLALAGANRPPDALGRLEGVLTGEELATLDLGHCELAVLSACDTNAGVRRAGTGVASLQAALHAAGARSVITSLWKVPDEATKDLMVDFYRRLWVEKKPRHQALWEAKSRLRKAKDESGRLRYTTHDWAAWVLSGAPR